MAPSRAAPSSASTARSQTKKRTPLWRPFSHGGEETESTVRLRPRSAAASRFRADFVSEAESLAASMGAVWAAPDAVTSLAEWGAHLARFHPWVLAVTHAAERLHRRDPDATKHRERYLREQLGACRRLASWLEREDRLAPHWTAETAADMLFALISADLLERLLHERSWSRRRLERQLIELLRATFVADRGYRV